MRVKSEFIDARLSEGLRVVYVAYVGLRVTCCRDTMYHWNLPGVWDSVTRVQKGAIQQVFQTN